MKTTLIIKLLALVIGSLLLVRLYFIAGGIPASIIAYSLYNNKDYAAIILHNPQHAYAYDQLAQSALETNDLKMAKYYSHKALQNNLSNGGALSRLVAIYNAENNPQRASEAAQLSAQLWPAHAVSMQNIAHHWIAQHQPQKALAALNVILTQHYNSKNASVFNPIEKKIFAIYEQIALQKDTKDFFIPYHQNPPTWWMHYFRYLATNENKTNNLPAVLRFYQQSIQYTQPQFPTLHKKLLLKRLGKEHQLKFAYDLWLGSLDKDAFTHTKLLYNGGFEGQVFNEGFAWIFGNMSDVHIYRDAVSRRSGHYSLHIAFNKWVSNYRGYLHQPLLLAPRTYTLTFHMRSQLAARKGLVWVVYCINDFDYLQGTLGQEIAKSQPFKGTLEWEKHTFNFTVPDRADCPAQGLFLDTASGAVIERRVRGDIWFDDMTITPISQSTQDTPPLIK